MQYLVDSYALFEWLAYANPNYKKFFGEIEESGSFTTHPTLLEFYFGVYHSKGETEADNKLAEVLAYLEVIPMDEWVVKAAGKFRSDSMKKKKNISYTDAINYVIAQRNHIKLLTGNKEFQGMEGVEFVK